MPSSSTTAPLTVRPSWRQSLGAIVVREDRRGFGAAAHAGLLAATAEFVAFCDCDGSLDPAQLPALLAPVMDGSADLVLGSRQPQRGSWPLHARIANLVLAWRIRRLTGEQVTDLGPMRAARREGLLSLGLEDRRSGYPLEMFLKASRHGWRIMEIPVPYAPRTGKSKVTGTVRGTMTAVRDMSAQLKAAAAALPAGTGPEGRPPRRTHMRSSMDLTVAVIAKECVPGRVKTRLSPPLTPERAAALAQLSLSRTLDSVRSLPARRPAAGHGRDTPRRTGRRANSRLCRRHPEAWTSGWPPSATQPAAPCSLSAWIRRNSHRHHVAPLLA